MRNAKSENGSVLKHFTKETGLETTRLTTLIALDMQREGVASGCNFTVGLFHLIQGELQSKCFEHLQLNGVLRGG